jgi:hypothetical protein
MRHAGWIEEKEELAVLKEFHICLFRLLFNKGLTELKDKIGKC